MLKYIDGAAKTIEIEGEIYRLQRRPRHPHVVLNNKRQGIRVLDPRCGRDICSVDFTDGYGVADAFINDGIINGWCFRSDGQAVLLLHEESRTGSLLSLSPECPSYSLKAPLLREITDLRYIWQKDSFWLTGGHSFGFFDLQWPNGEPTFVARGSIHARIKHRAWSKALDQLTALSTKVLRVEAEQERLIYYDFSEQTEQIGVLSWGDGASWSLPASKYTPVVAFHQDLLFVMYEYEVHAINQQGQVETIYSVPSGFYCGGLDIIPSDDRQPDALVVACNSLRDPEHSKILVYHLQ